MEIFAEATTPAMRGVLGELGGREEHAVDTTEGGAVAVDGAAGKSLGLDGCEKLCDGAYDHGGSVPKGMTPIFGTKIDPTAPCGPVVLAGAGAPFRRQ